MAHVQPLLPTVERLDPAAAATAAERYAVFERFATPRRYGAACAAGGELGEEGAAAVQRGVEAQLAELQAKNRDEYYGLVSPLEQFEAEQNAEVVVAGEEYYRQQHVLGGATWNTRDQHMANTVLRLRQHHEARNPPRREQSSCLLDSPVRVYRSTPST